MKPKTPYGQWKVAAIKYRQFDRFSYLKPFPTRKPPREPDFKREYREYCRAYDKALAESLIEKDVSKDQLIRELAMRRDGGMCRLWAVLTPYEKRELLQGGGDIIRILDTAHVFGKNANPHMRYDLDNVAMLFRTFHERLDQGKSPVSGKTIPHSEKVDWWRRIVGEQLYDILAERSVLHVQIDSTEEAQSD
jgi:hypothetical protein